MEKYAVISFLASFLITVGILTMFSDEQKPFSRSIRYFLYRLFSFLCRFIFVLGIILVGTEFWFGETLPFFNDKVFDLFFLDVSLVLVSPLVACMFLFLFLEKKLTEFGELLSLGETKAIKKQRKQERTLSQEFSRKITVIEITEEITKRGKQAERELRQLEMEAAETGYGYRVKAKGILSSYLVDTKRMIKNSNLNSVEKKQFEQLTTNTVNLLLAP